jgi:hypothetical protein
MSVFRADLAAALLVACASQAWAQAALPQPVPPLPLASAVLPQSPVQVEALGTPEGPPAGLLDSTNGGLGQGIWTDSPRALIEDLLARLPLATTVPSVHALGRRLLLTAADAPPGAAPRSFVSTRVQKLLEAGLLVDAADLAMKAEPPGNPEFARLRATAILFAGRTDDACGPATDLRMKENDSFWIELRAFCYAAAGNDDALELTRQVLRARGIADKAFDVMLGDVVTHAVNDPGEMTNPNALHIYLLRKLGLPIDPSLDAQLGLPADVLAMRDSADTPADRLRATEAAARAGAAMPIEVADIVDAQSFPPEQIENAETAAVTLPFLEGQALLRQALAQQTDFSVRGALLYKALTLGAENNEPYLSAQLQADAEAAIRPDSSMRNLAPPAAIALLMAGRPGPAADWMDALNWNAIPDRTFASAFAAMIALAAPNDERAVDAQKALAWLLANADASPATAQVAALVTGLYRAVGLPVPPAPAPPALPASPPQNLVPDPPLLRGRRPPPSVQMQIAAGTNDPGRKGEAILAMLDFVGKDGPGDLAPDVTSTFVSALVKMGEPDAARSFAIDALLLYQPPTVAP